MAFSVKDVISLSQAHATRSDLANQVQGGTEKTITQNGQSYAALVGAQRLDYEHTLETTHRGRQRHYTSTRQRQLDPPIRDGR